MRLSKNPNSRNEPESNKKEKDLVSIGCNSRWHALQPPSDGVLPTRSGPEFNTTTIIDRPDGLCNSKNPNIPF